MHKFKIYLGLLISSIYSLSAFAVIIPAPPQLAASAYILIDADTGKVLVEENADEQLPPASLTKMMTSYIVSHEIDSGRIKATDEVPISVKAWQMGGSKMFVREGTKVPVEDLLRGVIIQSGNDASVALAEYVAGSESAFADVMNQQAQLLGMTHTTYKNATGWPADGHVTTARDLSLLARALIRDFPDHYSLYSEKYFKYNGINQPNRNKLLFRDKSVDGLKTGHTEAAGYCLVSSAKKNGMRLISVVMGTKSDESRASESQKLLAYGFRYYTTHQLYAENQVLSTPRVWGGLAQEVNLSAGDAVYLTIPRGSEDSLQAQLHVDQVIKAPVSVGQELGNLTVELDGEVLLDVPLLAQENVAEAGFFARIWDDIKLFFIGFFA